MSARGWTPTSRACESGDAQAVPTRVGAPYLPYSRHAQVQEVVLAGPGFWQQRVPAGPALAALYRTGVVYVQRRAGAPAADAPAPEAAGAGAPDAHAAEPDALPQARHPGG